MDTMRIHHVPAGELRGPATAAPVRPARQIPLRQWLLLAAALVTLSAPVLVTPSAAATALGRPAAAAHEAAPRRDLSEAAAVVALALGLLGLGSMGRRPRALDASRSR
jgi:hypothetical protein